MEKLKMKSEKTFHPFQCFEKKSYDSNQIMHLI
jgi:hypothetical protein